MILVADAAPLIFLAKINQLSLLTELFKAEIFLPSAVRKEILGPEVPPDEERVLTAFLSGCKVVNLRKPAKFAQALSFADNCILTLATREGAAMVLSDDRLLRKTAVIEGFGVIGTLGILLRAATSSLIGAEVTKTFIQQLVENHNFRISTTVYNAALKALSEFD
jgi:predicted nucleic acid-binding protein